MRHSPLRFNHQTIYTILLVVSIMGFWLFENYYTPRSRPVVPLPGMGIPEYIEPSATSGSVVKHHYFWLSYREEYEQAEWVAYTLQPEHLTDDNRKRPFFIEDPYVRTHSADWRNYRGSGFDRGHLCPAGDRRFTETAYDETFYTSNISPQDNTFNAGVWNRLEIQVRKWCREYGTVYVVTGGVFTKGMKKIGDENVAIPGSFYKIIARGGPQNLSVVAFLIPHRGSTAPLEAFLVPVDEVERVTGIDFFQSLSSGVEAALESAVPSSGWDL